MVQVKQVVDAVRHEHPGDADNREFREFAYRLPQAAVSRSAGGHRLPLHSAPSSRLSAVCRSG